MNSLSEKNIGVILTICKMKKTQCKKWSAKTIKEQNFQTVKSLGTLVSLDGEQTNDQYDIQWGSEHRTIFVTIQIVNKSRN